MKKQKKENNFLPSDTEARAVRKKAEIALSFAATALALTLCITGSVFSFAMTESDDSSERYEKNEAEAVGAYVSQEKLQKIDEFEKNLSDIDALVDELDSQISENKQSSVPKDKVYTKELYDKKANLLLARSEICGEYSEIFVSWAEETRVLLAEPIAEYEKYNEVYKERLAVVYENGFPDLSEVFGSSDTLMEFVMGKVMLNKVKRYDSDLADKAEELYEVVEDGLNAVKYYLAMSEKYSDMRAQTEKQFVSSSLEASEYLQSICREKDTYSYFLQYSSQQDQIFASLISSAISENGVGTGKAPELSFPLGDEYFYTDYIGRGHDNRYEFSSALGKYVNIFHSGIDLSTPRQHAGVRAAADGKVIFADYCPIRGYTVAVLHSSSLVSVYSGCSMVLAETLTEVSAGELIAFSGMSGNSESFKVTFEVFADGEFTDPAPYIKMPDVSLSENQK